jgi:hypothetical protein
MARLYTTKPMKMLLRFTVPLHLAMHHCLAVCLIVFTCGCSQLSDDFVPTQEIANSRHAEFLAEPKSFTGVYSNFDVDCEVFTYETAKRDETKFWKNLDGSLNAQGWKLTQDSADRRTYERITPKAAAQHFHSTEQVGFHFHSKTGVVTVAWVQADTFEPIKEFKLADESKFADRSVWPKFEALCDR